MEKERQRIIEISYYLIYDHLRNTIPSAKLFLVLEVLCRAFEVEYTDIGNVSSSYMAKIKPATAELAILSHLSAAPIKLAGFDYRTVRKYVKFYKEGSIELIPRIRNKFLMEELEKFIKGYVSLFPSEMPIVSGYILE